MINKYCEYFMIGGLSLIGIALILASVIDVKIYGPALGVTIFNGLGIFFVGTLVRFGFRYAVWK